MSIENCYKVLDAFEELLGEELSNSKDISGAFEKIYKTLSYFKK